MKNQNENRPTLGPPNPEICADSFIDSDSADGDWDEQIRGWLLYDESCGFCDRWVHFWKPVLAKRGFKVQPLQSEFAKTHVSLPDDAMLSEFRLLVADGQLVEGANAYRYVMRRIYWAYPLYVISILPVFSLLFDFGYRWFRDHRHQVSKACRLPPAEGKLTRKSR
ncbi:MAG: hypothetical protein DHS20C16_15840 [Phycisphaerae bacterium]|nr:MAG: hypothetical protein DHS20C16_15840 [Phycisphaerae bacterium]